MKVGLIAEGGGMRGAYTAGVLEAFLNHNLQFPYAIGVSAGANTLCSYLSGQQLRNKRLFTEWITDKRFINWRNIITEGAYFGMKFLFDDIPTTLDPFDLKAFRHNPTCFKVGVTNCLTGKCEFMNLKKAPTLKEMDQILKASSSLPFISHTVLLNGVPYLDGGLSEAIPIRQAQKDGCRYNVVILTRNRAYRKKFSKKMYCFAKVKLKRYPKLVEVMKERHEVYNRTLDYLNRLEKEGKVFILSPKLPLKVERFEKDQHKLEELYEQGYREAIQLMPQLKTWMGRLKA